MVAPSSGLFRCGTIRKTRRCGLESSPEPLASGQYEEIWCARAARRPPISEIPRLFLVFDVGGDETPHVGMYPELPAGSGRTVLHRDTRRTRLRAPPLHAERRARSRRCCDLSLGS